MIMEKNTMQKGVISMHLPTEKHTSRKKRPTLPRKWLVLLLVLVVFLLTAGIWMGMPRSLGAQLPAEQPITLAISTSEVHTTGSVTAEGEQLTYQPDTEAYTALVRLLDDTNYHCTFKSLIPAHDFHMDRQSVTVQFSAGQQHWLLTDRGDLAIQKTEAAAYHRYRISTEDAQQICEMIQASIME